MAKALHTEIEIGASAERVWQVLSDLDAYPEWNPLLRSMSGTLTAGTRLRIKVRLAWWFWMIIRPEVIQATPPTELRWKGRLIFSSLFHGVHDFEIVDRGNNSSVLIQHESFGGLLRQILSPILLPLMRKGFVAMNEALKRVAESA